MSRAGTRQRSATRARSALTACFVVLTALTSGCSGDTTSSASCSERPAAVECVSGSYTLVSLNGQALPAFTDATKTEQWSAATLVLKSDKTLTGTVTWKQYSGATVVDSGTDPFTGSYTTDGTTLSIVIEAEPPASAAVASDGTLTMNASGMQLTFKKQ